MDRAKTVLNLERLNDLLDYILAALVYLLDKLEADLLKLGLEDPPDSLLPALVDDSIIFSVRSLPLVRCVGGDAC